MAKESVAKIKKRQNGDKIRQNLSEDVTESKNTNLVTLRNIFMMYH